MNILIVDNSSTVRSKIEKLLLEMEEGYEDLSMDIHLYENSVHALEYIEENNLDLIFSSIETKDLDGVDFVELILAKKPEYQSKIFIVTTQSKTDHFDEIKGVGAKRFIKKPINEEHFKHYIVPEIYKALHPQLEAI